MFPKPSFYQMFSVQKLKKNFEIFTLIDKVLNLNEEIKKKKKITSIMGFYHTLFRFL